jgi:RNA polymerase sigma factor (sigma-70 family)
VDDRRTHLLVSLAQRRGPLCRRVARRVGCPALAADIVQDACVHMAVRNLAAVRCADALVGSVVSNATVDALRRRRRHERCFAAVEPPSDLPDRQPLPDAVLAARERLAIVRRATGELPPRCRAVFELLSDHDLDHGEIAARLGISRNMVDKHVRKALAHCQARLAAAEA